MTEPDTTDGPRLRLQRRWVLAPVAVALAAGCAWAAFTFLIGRHFPSGPYAVITSGPGTTQTYKTVTCTTKDGVRTFRVATPLYFGAYIVTVPLASPSQGTVTFTYASVDDEPNYGAYGVTGSASMSADGRYATFTGTSGVAVLPIPPTPSPETIGGIIDCGSSGD